MSYILPITTKMKTKRIQVRVSKNEKVRIEKQARRENFPSAAAFLRKIALDRVRQK